MSNHTKGKWVAEIDKTKISKGWFDILELNGKGDVNEFIGNIHGEANARLIKKSPQMYEQLKYAIKVFEKHCLCSGLPDDGCDFCLEAYRIQHLLTEIEGNNE